MQSAQSKKCFAEMSSEYAQAHFLQKLEIT